MRARFYLALLSCFLLLKSNKGMTEEGLVQSAQARSAWIADDAVQTFSVWKVLLITLSQRSDDSP